MNEVTEHFKHELDKQKDGFQVQVLKAEGLRSADFSGVKLATFNSL